MQIYGAQIEMMKQKALNDSQAVEEANANTAKAVEADAGGGEGGDQGGAGDGGGE